MRVKQPFSWLVFNYVKFQSVEISQAQRLHS